MLDQLYYDDRTGFWRVALHRASGFLEDLEVVLMVPEPMDRTQRHECTAKLRGPSAYLYAVGGPMAKDA